ncbi:MAG TPA: hypothetical protein PLE93_02900, partial [Solirubrobacterales bacterium]|nr:hypothetical protein [Solirubrobacterales bacterium]
SVIADFHVQLSSFLIAGAIAATHPATSVQVAGASGLAGTEAITGKQERDLLKRAAAFFAADQ